MGDSLRAKVIRLAHQQPALRPHLLPLLQEGRTAAMSHLAAVKQPRSGKPVYEGNAMAIPLSWGSAGKIEAYELAKDLYELFANAKGGVAYVLDQNGVFAATGLSAVERATQNYISDRYHEDYAMDLEYFQDDDTPRGLGAIEKSRDMAKMAEKIRVSITPVTSPTSGKSGLKVVFKPTHEQIESIR